MGSKLHDVSHDAPPMPMALAAVPFVASTSTLLVIVEVLVAVATIVVGLGECWIDTNDLVVVLDS